MIIRITICKRKLKYSTNGISTKVADTSVGSLPCGHKMVIVVYTNKCLYFRSLLEFFLAHTFCNNSGVSVDSSY